MASSLFFNQNSQYNERNSSFSAQRFVETVADTVPGRMHSILSIEEELPCDSSLGVMINREATFGNGVSAVMNAELAIRRELAYRSKMESLETQSRRDFQQLPLSVQGEPSNKDIVGTQIRPQLENPSCLPPRQKLVPSNFQQPPLEGPSCLPPRQKLVPSNFQQPPLEGPSCLPRPQKLVAPNFQEPRLENPSGFPPQKLVQAPDLFCKQCRVLCTCTSALQDHYQGKKHMERVEQLESQSGELWPDGLSCRMCNISCPDKIALRMHFTGKKHASCLKAMRSINRAKKAKKHQQARPWRRTVS